MAKDGAMPQQKHPEILEGEEFLFNDPPDKDLMKEYGQGNIWESLRYGEIAYSSDGNIVPHSKPVFGIRKKYDDPLDTGGENLN